MPYQLGEGEKPVSAQIIAGCTGYDQICFIVGTATRKWDGMLEGGPALIVAIVKEATANAAAPILSFGEAVSNIWVELQPDSPAEFIKLWLVRIAPFFASGENSILEKRTPNE